MPFRPSIHGWPFDSDRSWDPSVLGLGASPIPELGLGGGMCWAALDRYLAGISVPPRAPAPEPGEPLHAELVRRQAAALSGVWEKVRRLDAAPTGPGRWLQGGDAASRTRREWRAARRRLDAGEPVLLTVLPRCDAYSRGRAAWQVLATGYTREDGRVQVSIYDPGRPGDDHVQLSFRTSGELDALMSGGRQLRGFFTVPYDRDRGLVMRAESFGDRSVIGLNRKVRGRVTGVARGSTLHVVGRDPDGGLIHFSRAGRPHWEGANVTERLGAGTHELHSDPTVVLAGRTLHVFARSYVGDLLHYRMGRRWTVRNRTDHRRVGSRFRLAGEPVPVAGPRWRLAVLGRDGDGGLIHYALRLLKGWTAEQVPGEPLAEDPKATWIGEDLHVIGVTADRRLMAWERPGDGEWVVHDLSTGRDKGPSFRVAGRPAMLAHGNALHVFARDADGRLVHFRRGEDGRWSAAARGDAISGDPAATTGPAGIHVFVRTVDSTLLHVWGEEEWHQEDVVASRPGLAARDWPGRLTAWGSASRLRVTGLQGRRLMVLDWRADSDWTASPLVAWSRIEPRQCPAEDPVLVEDGEGRPHLFATDGHGTVVHAEPGQWVEPTVAGRSAAHADQPPADSDRAAAVGPIADADAAAAAATAGEAGGAELEPEPVPMDDPIDFEDMPRMGWSHPEEEAPSALAERPSEPEVPGDPDDVPALLGIERTSLVDDAEPEPEPEPERMEFEHDSLLPEPGPLVETDDPLTPAVGAPAQEPLQEIEEAAPEPDSEPEPAPERDEPPMRVIPDDYEVTRPAEPAAAAEPEPLPGLEPDEPTVEPEPESAASGGAPVEVFPWEEAASEPDGGEKEQAEGVPDVAEAEEDGDDAGEPVEFPWENVAASGERPERNGRPHKAPEVEPMDLSLLDSWPEEPKLRPGRGSRKAADG